MRLKHLFSGLVWVLCNATARASPDPSALAQTDRPTPAEIVQRAPDSAWRTIDPADLMVIDLAGGGRVVIELAASFAPVHLANIRALIAAHWFDATSINRVQDDYVVQWGDATQTKPLPPGVIAQPPAEYERSDKGLPLVPLDQRDSYAKAVGFVDDWPVGRDPAHRILWLTHCYGAIGVGRNPPPDTGSGAELYAVIGQAPRQLDRNLTVVGRIVDGITAIDTLPRGTAALGFYAMPHQRTAIVSVRLASDLPAIGRPAWQVMRTGSDSFATYAHARANRTDAFYVRPAGGVDLCNLPVPFRPAPPLR